MSVRTWELFTSGGDRRPPAKGLAIRTYSSGAILFIEEPFDSWEQEPADVQMDAAQLEALAAAALEAAAVLRS